MPRLVRARRHEPRPDVSLCLIVDDGAPARFARARRQPALTHHAALPGAARRAML